MMASLLPILVFFGLFEVGMMIVVLLAHYTMKAEARETELREATERQMVTSVAEHTPAREGVAA